VQIFLMCSAVVILVTYSRASAPYHPTSESIEIRGALRALVRKSARYQGFWRQSERI
jgi:hypothetical protein